MAVVDKVVDVVVEAVVEAVVDAVVRIFRDTFRYKDNVFALDFAIERLEIQQERVSSRIHEKKDDGGRKIQDLYMWQKEAAFLHSLAREFSYKYVTRRSWRCIPLLPIPNPIARFKLGREARLMTYLAQELYYDGMEHLNEDINVPNDDTVYEDLKSRKDVYKKLRQALFEESSLITGIYGMGGVGKTTMIERIWKEAKANERFKMFTRADVGRADLDTDLEVIKLQNQIAYYLNCNFESQDNVESRASQLKNILMNGGKVLIILDDVRSKIDFGKIGISFGNGSSSKGCKILLASRDKDVCLINKCKHPIEITTLTSDELQNLFINSVGTDKISSPQDKSLVEEICKKCGDLPLTISLVGKSLRSTPSNLWKDALRQLDKVENIAGIDPQVYACIKFSIDSLKEDAKSCLFLCSLFPEVAKIPLKKLVKLAAVLLVPSGEYKIFAMVDTLRSSSLLFDSEHDYSIKLHDLIRNVASVEASKDPKYAFSQLKCGSRSGFPHSVDYGTRKLLCLDLEDDNVPFDEDLVYSDLQTLWLQCNKHIQQFSGGFFHMFVNLRCLLIQEGVFSSSLQLPFSLQPLGKLKILILEDCDMTIIGNINVSLFPGNLETLHIWNCHLPVPLHLSNLKDLKTLVILGKKDEVQFVPNAISSLSSLVELHIPNGFQMWDDGSTVPAPILAEISKLTGLKSLKMLLRDSQPFQDTNIFCNLVEFDIHVGEAEEDIHNFKRLIVGSGYRVEGLESLMDRAEEVVLRRITSVDLSSIWNSNRQAFAELRNLYIKDCETMEHLARTSQDEIQHNRQIPDEIQHNQDEIQHNRQPQEEILSNLQPHLSFSKLTNLDIDNCSAIKYLFCNSVAKCLIQLQYLCVYNCPVLEAIVMNVGRSNTNIINFSKLKSLKLLKLPRLKSFCSDNSAPSVQSPPLFDGMVAFPSLEILHIENLEDTSDIWAKHFYSDNVSSFCELKKLTVSRLNKPEIVIPPAMLRRLQNLECLIIYCCSSLISEVGTYISNAAVCPLKALCAMELESLPCLTKTGLNFKEHSGEMTLYPNLKNLRIHDCNRLRNVFCPSIARDLAHLKEMRVSSCKMMRMIIGVGKTDVVDRIVFPELINLKLINLPNLTSIWCYKVEFPESLDFKKLDCAKLTWKP